MMVSYIIIILNCLLLSSTVEAQFNLYYTDFISDNDWYYNCLHYKVTDDIVKYGETEKDFQSPYQIIPYCICPL
jgi:hypothetical protein